MYSVKNIDGKKSNTAKGVNIATEFNEFKDTLFNKKSTQTQNEKNSRQKKKKLVKCEINKISLSCFNEKKIVLDGEIDTPAYFHEDLNKNHG